VLSLCLVVLFLVALAAVGLKPIQKANKDLDVSETFCLRVVMLA